MAKRGTLEQADEHTSNIMWRDTSDALLPIYDAMIKLAQSTMPNERFAELAT